MFRLQEEFIQKIKAATLNGSAAWINVDGFLCSESSFEGSTYMICKYPLDDSAAFDVSFNKLNKHNNMIRPYLEFSVGDKFYGDLIELADIVWEKKTVIAA